MTILRSAAICLALATWPAAGQTRSYTNEQYGFSALIPAPLAPCPHIPPASDHGYLAPLPGQECGPLPSGAYLSVNASSNVTESLDPRRVAQWECGPAPIRPTRINPRLSFYRCDRRDGGQWLEIHYVALRLRSDWAFGVSYSAILRCRPANCARHEPLLRRAVASMRFQ